MISPAHAAGPGVITSLHNGLGVITDLVRLYHDNHSGGMVYCHYTARKNNLAPKLKRRISYLAGNATSESATTTTLIKPCAGRVMCRSMTRLFFRRLRCQYVSENNMVGINGMLVKHRFYLSLILNVPITLILTEETWIYI